MPNTGEMRALNQEQDKLPPNVIDSASGEQVAGEFESHKRAGKELSQEDKVIVEEPGIKLDLVPPIDETAEWIEQEAKKAGASRQDKYAKAEAEAREKQFTEAEKKEQAIAQETKRKADEQRDFYKKVEKYKTESPEQSLQVLADKMRELNQKRSKVEDQLTRQSEPVSGAIGAIKKLGWFRDTDDAIERSLKQQESLKLEIVKIDESIGLLESQMDEEIRHLGERGAEKQDIQVAGILKDTKMDISDRTAIEEWFVNPEAEFSSDDYESEPSYNNPEVLATLKSNSLLKIEREAIEKKMEENIENLKSLEAKLDSLEEKGEEKFSHILGFDIEELQINKPAWGRLIFKARLGKLRNEFADWEKEYKQVIGQVVAANEEIAQDELWLKDPHKAAVLGAQRLVRLMSSRVRSATTSGRIGLPML